MNISPFGKILSPTDSRHPVVSSVQFWGTEDYYIMFKRNGEKQRTIFLCDFTLEFSARISTTYNVRSTYGVLYVCLNLIF